MLLRRRSESSLGNRLLQSFKKVQMRADFHRQSHGRPKSGGQVPRKGKGSPSLPVFHHDCDISFISFAIVPSNSSSEWNQSHSTMQCVKFIPVIRNLSGCECRCEIIEFIINDGYGRKLITRKWYLVILLIRILFLTNELSQNRRQCSSRALRWSRLERVSSWEALDSSTRKECQVEIR